MRQLDFIDILAMVLLFIIFIPITHRIYGEQQRVYNQSKMAELEDKNIRNRGRLTDSVEISGGEVNSWEVLLSTQIQNYYMPKPKQLSVGKELLNSNGEVIGKTFQKPMVITSTVQEDRDSYTKRVGTMLKEIGGEQYIKKTDETGNEVDTKVAETFVLRFNPGEDFKSDADDFYYFEKTGAGS